MAGDDETSAGAGCAADPGRTRPSCWWLLACLPAAWTGSGELVLAAFGYPAPCVHTPASAFADAFTLLPHLLFAFLLLALMIGVALLLPERGRSRWWLLLSLLVAALVHMTVRIQLLQGPAEFC
ncbi:hypothetical protein ACFV4P_12070 [Kitasatospora sp. NPDC059795]|uniref:hypothetical protein n=1 Tax=Kitasatospora sp. NPDC059795 TaxID=3346949 RepID=UPI0036629142